MALQKSIEYNTITYPTAYIHIERWTGNQSHSLLQVNVYPSQAARTQSDPEAAVQSTLYAVYHRVEHADLDLENQNDIQQAFYNYLKTLPEYAGAADV